MTLNVESVLGSVVFSSVGTKSGYVPYLALDMPHSILVVYLGGLNVKAVAC